MLRTRPARAWITGLLIGAFGGGCCAWLLWQQEQLQESRAEWQHRLEDQDTRHDLAQRQLKARNAELDRRVAELESEIDRLSGVHDELAAIHEHWRQASEQIQAMEAKMKAAEAADAMLALQHEVMKSKHAASEIASLGERRLRLSKPTIELDARRKTTVASPPVPDIHAFRKGLYAFAELEVSEPPDRREGSISLARQAVHAKSEDDRTTNAAARSIKAAFKRADAPSQSMSKTDWAEAQLELGRALATKGQGSSGTRELTEAALAFRAVASERSREKTPLGWATVQFELGRTLALLSRRSGDPSVRQESIVALGNALDALVQAGQSSRAAEAKRLLDEMEDGSYPGQPSGGG